MPSRTVRLAATLCVALAAVSSTAAAQAAPRPGTLGVPPRQPPTRPTPGGPITPLPGAAIADTGKPLALFGVVYDSIARAPLAGATVQIVGETDRSRSFMATTDSSGAYRMPNVRPGRYLAGFFHPSIDAIGLEAPPQLIAVMPDTAARLDFGTPGPRRVKQLLCGPTAPGDSTGALLGLVRDAESGSAVQGARVVVTWNELQVSTTGIRNARRRYPARARPEGGFVVCGLPADGAVVANAEAPGRPGGLIEVEVPARGLVRRDFFLGDSSSIVTVQLPDTMAQVEQRPANAITVTRGNARLTGVVRGRDGRVLEGARLQIWGSGVTGSTSGNGAFALGGLPAGTFSLDVRAIGYEPKRIAVDLSARRPNSVEVVLDKQVATLGSVVVTGERNKADRDYSGFLARQKNGFGKYMTEEQIAQRNAFVMTDLMRTTPGLSVSPNGSFGYVVRGRGGCTPGIFIDGMPVTQGADDLDNLVRPSDVAGVEVYTSTAGAPAQFAGTAGNGCGVIAVWTKRGGGSRAGAR